jgi:hypothetical protein
MINAPLLIVECLVGLSLVLERNLLDDRWNFGGLMWKKILTYLMVLVSV